MLFWIAVIAIIAWFFLAPAKEKPSPVLALPVAPPPVQAVPFPSHGVSCLQALRKKLASDEKLTPELKSAFDAIASAIKDGGDA